MKTFIILLLVIAVALGGYLLWRSSQEDIELGDPFLSVTPDESAREPLPDGVYVLDVEASKMQWQGQKTILTAWVDRGSIDLIEGNVTISEGTATEGRLVVDMTSIVTESTGRGSGETQMANHLKSADFFDVEEYPTSVFELDSFTKEDDGTYTVAGSLTIKGKTNPVSFPATLSVADDTLTLTGNARLDRTEWDVRYGSDSFFDNLGDNVIDDFFTVAFQAVAIREVASE